MAQRSVSVRNDMRRAFQGGNKAADLRIKEFLDHAQVIIPIAVADGSTVLTGPTLSSAIVVTGVSFLKGGSTGGSTDAVQLCTDSGGTTAVSASFALDTVAAGTTSDSTTLTNTAFAAGAKMYVKRTHTTDCSGVMYVKGYLA